jgi:hypothetical protein
MKRSKSDADQRVRFVEAAKKIGADDTGRKFEKAFKAIVHRRRTKVKEAPPK